MKQPIYEAENDYGCSCNEDGMESEWEWCEDEEIYKCTGCGDVQ